MLDGLKEPMKYLTGTRRCNKRLLSVKIPFRRLEGDGSCHYLRVQGILREDVTDWWIDNFNLPGE